MPEYIFIIYIVYIHSHTHLYVTTYNKTMTVNTQALIECTEFQLRNVICRAFT